MADKTLHSYGRRDGQMTKLLLHIYNQKENQMEEQEAQGDHTNESHDP